MTLNLAAGTKQHALKERKDDLYETPAIAVHKLATVERLPTCIWEPACGPGAIVRELRGLGHTVYATDLVDYASRDQDEAGWDFLMQRQLPIGVQAIVTNPPFKLAEQFAALALGLGTPLVCMLLRLAFLESEARTGILEGGQLARVHVFRKRLPMMHRAGWQGPRASSAMAFAWFVWDRDHQGPTILNRI